jgi:ribonuclease P protein component
VLPAGSRLRRRADFVATVRSTRGVRGTGLLVVHAATPDPITSSALSPAQTSPPRVGFVVSRSVGAAVVRNRVRRRLRHLVVEQLDRLPPGSRVVVRALPGSAAATYDQLGTALGSALDRALGRAPDRAANRDRAAARA